MTAEKQGPQEQQEQREQEENNSVQAPPRTKERGARWPWILLGGGLAALLFLPWGAWSQTGKGQGQGQGRGLGPRDGSGQGMGRGRGMGQGRGRGMGQGRGQGMGRGRGMGQGMGKGLGRSGQGRGMGPCDGSGPGSRWGQGNGQRFGQGKGWQGNGRRWKGNGRRWKGNGRRWQGRGRRWQGNGRRWKGHGRRWQGRGRGRMWSGASMDDMIEAGLSKDQASRITKIRDTSDKKLDELAQKARRTRLQMGSAWTADTLDMGKVRNLHNKMKGIHGQISDARFELKADVAKILTTDQRKSFLSRRFGRRGFGGGRFGGI